ncbi:cytochrome c oxidase assembly protein subunit 15 [Microbacteriaceae bacterium MWH-Ta3]|nr:cytochrome c oxidase assembly protein subunit 15 [Microbacteriaceae bacterium MWH-Ta3]
MPLRLPVSPATRTVRGLALASLVSEIVIVVTGGAVRLTGSGLGCPEWPLCTTESLVNTPEMGIHGFIEFANRTLTGPLLLIALAMVVVLWNMRRTRRDLWWLSIALVAGILLQAVIGGVSVWVDLGPYVVGVHFLVSAILVALAALLVMRVWGTTLPKRRDVSFAGWGFAGLTLLVIVAGVLTTGAGPHSGDTLASRNGLFFGDVLAVHRVLGLVAMGYVAASVVMMWRDVRSRRAWLWVFANYCAQITVGVIQVEIGLPAALVGVHLLLSMTIIATTVRAIYVSTTSGSIATATNNAVK